MGSSESRSAGPRTLVMGLGNILLKDEGIGVHLAWALQDMGVENADVQVVDCGTCLDSVLFVDKVDKLVILDAAEGGCRPGTVYRFRPEDLPRESDPQVHSLHEVNLMESLRMLDLLGLKPENIVIFGVQPGEMDWGLEPSVELTERVPEILRLVLEETREC